MMPMVSEPTDNIGKATFLPEDAEETRIWIMRMKNHLKQLNLDKWLQIAVIGNHTEGGMDDLVARDIVLSHLAENVAREVSHVSNTCYMWQKLMYKYNNLKPYLKNTDIGQ